jgi:hypothetical protein
MASGPLRHIRAAGDAFRKVTLWISGDEADVSTSPTLTSGSGAPSASAPNGSIYLRTNGGAASTLYARISGAWAPPMPATFLSAEVTGNGSAQSTAHGLATIPTLVFAIPSNMTAGAFVVAYGTHTTTDAVVTVTNGEKYRIVAFK